MRVYIRIDPELVEKKSKYPDGALVAFISAICAAEQQPNRGRFKTVKILKAYLGTRARWIPYLMAHHDLVELENGSLYVDGWDEWQEGDWKVRERVERIRNRQKVTVPVTPAVTVPVTVGETVPRRALTLPDSPSEPLAVSRKPLAVSEHGDEVVHEQANGASATPSPTEVQHLKGWLFGKRGWNDVKRETHVHEEAIAKQILSLGTPWSELQQPLDDMWDQTDPDDRPSSLAYFWTRLQDEAHARIKQQLPSHVSTGNELTKVKPVAPPRVAPAQSKA